MLSEIQYTNIRRVLDDLMDHPMLRDLTLEQVVRYTVRFISLHGYPKLYQDREAEIDIHQYRGALPCDLISIVQVKDCKSGICMRSMTDSFNPEGHEGNCFHGVSDLAFKTQGRVIYTSFPEGKVTVAYKAVPVDDDGFPLLIDNETYLAALEAYIKKQVFTIKFDQGNISAGVLQNAQRDYAMLSGELMSEMTLPSVSEMESITRMWNTLIPRVREFDKGFRDLGNQEYLRVQ